MTDSEEVLDARIASGRHTSSSSAKSVRLELEVLRNGLDDEVGVGEVGQRVVVMIRASSASASSCGELAAADGPRRGHLEVLAAALDGVVVDLGGDHAQAVAREHLDDARAHRAQTDDADRPELPCHPVILPDPSAIRCDADNESGPTYGVARGGSPEAGAAAQAGDGRRGVRVGRRGRAAAAVTSGSRGDGGWRPRRHPDRRCRSSRAQPSRAGSGACGRAPHRALIGEGGMGVVYRASHLQLRRTVALKVLPPSLTADREYRHRFEREAAIAASLEHPNVVPIYDAGYANGCCTYRCGSSTARTSARSSGAKAGSTSTAVALWSRWPTHSTPSTRGPGAPRRPAPRSVRRAYADRTGTGVTMTTDPFDALRLPEVPSTPVRVRGASAPPDRGRARPRRPPAEEHRHAHHHVRHDATRSRPICSPT